MSGGNFDYRIDSFDPSLGKWTLEDRERAKMEKGTDRSHHDLEAALKEADGLALAGESYAAFDTSLFPC